MSENYGKPACFGMPSCRSVGSDACTACQYDRQCQENCLVILQNIHQTIDVSDVINKISRQLEKSRVITEEKSVVVSDYIPQTAVRTEVEKVEFEPTEQEMLLIDKLNPTARKFAMTLCKKGLIDKIKIGVINGKNSLNDFNIKWLQIALQCLIDGGFTKSDLAQRYINDLQWTENTARNHVSLAVRIFCIFGIATDRHDCVVLSERLKVEK